MNKKEVINVAKNKEVENKPTPKNEPVVVEKEENENITCSGCGKTFPKKNNEKLIGVNCPKCKSGKYEN